MSFGELTAFNMKANNFVPLSLYILNTKFTCLNYENVFYYLIFCTLHFVFIYFFFQVLLTSLLDIAYYYESYVFKANQKKGRV